jgi:hypothetical protein
MIRNLVLAQTINRKVSFAVSLTDDFTGLSVKEQMRVFTVENNRDAIRNASGYYVFTDLPDNTYTVRIENTHYGAQEVAVIISELDHSSPLVTVTLKPCYLYPFGQGSTLVRGRVVDVNGNPVPGALIEIAGKDIKNSSESDGRFVLYFGPLTTDDISEVNNHKYVISGNGLDFQLKVTHPDYRDYTRSIGKIEEGVSGLLATPITLSPA